MPISWIHNPCKALDNKAADAARTHQSLLTKPAGSLGELEDIALKFAAWQGSAMPKCDFVLIRIFAADHGVCQQGVSAFPQEVTAQMVANFTAGGAAINVLANQVDADFAAVNLGTVVACEDAANLVNEQIAKGTADFSQTPAMTLEQLSAAFEAGRRQIINTSADLFIAGDMGIGNTTSASAIYSAVLQQKPQDCVGPGTGLDEAGVAHKAKVIQQSLALHKDSLDQTIDVLRCLGGLEIAAMAAAYISAAQKGCPILVDGFISTAAALVASELNPACRDWMLFAHKSAEPAHHLALDYLNARPLLDLGLRLGEGSGAALAVPIVQSALALHNKMATFTSSGVSQHE